MPTWAPFRLQVHFNGHGWRARQLTQAGIGFDTADNVFCTLLDWDDAAKVWYVEDSNVPGLVGEAATLEAMMVLLKARVPEMLEENGCPTADEIPLRLLASARLGQMRAIA